MDKTFWHHKWEAGDTAFHQDQVNPALCKYFDQLKVNKGARILVPLCGKTSDIAWLLSQGYQVVGVELSQKAIDQLFENLGTKPMINRLGAFEHYHAENIDILIGDFFQVSKGILGHVDAVYDRAALVALPYEMREKYTKHLSSISNQVPQLLICYEYDQRLQEGPPFSVNKEEVKRHYSNLFELTLLETIDIPGGLKGKCAAQEDVWLLKARTGKQKNV